MLGATTCIIGIVSILCFFLDVKVENTATRYAFVISGIVFVAMAVITFIFESSLCY